MNYVVAVSGGVDSMALLDMLVNNRCKSLQIPLKNLVVAHFDHGIREDSSSDEKMVRGVVGEYGLAYESAEGKLGSDASEETARKARYNFLRQVCKKSNAALITGHHQDDLIETMIINLIRGTNWRGLVSLDSNSEIVRPLLYTSKRELVAYAEQHQLEWREDSTNQNEAYLRNYIRINVVPAMLRKDPTSVDKLTALYEETRKLKKDIATELQKQLIRYQTSNIKYCIPRYILIMMPPLVAQELIYNALTRIDPDWHPNSNQIVNVLHFIKTGLPSKVMQVSGGLNVQLTEREVQFKKA